MSRQISNGMWKILSITVLLGLTGCGKEYQLQQVAKDWCMTIRASQVIPVYPLTEDIQPGDVFLVRKPIQKQTEEYKERGFLALDQQMARLWDLDYATFYHQSHGTSERENMPQSWKFPPDGFRELKSHSDETSPNREVTVESSDKNGSSPRHKEFTEWGAAPRAGFPTYVFEVSTSAGAEGILGIKNALFNQGALPINAVPVGMSLLGAHKARASVTIKDAYTYGVDYDLLHQQVYQWAAQAKIRRMLQSYWEQAANEMWHEWIWRHVAGLFVRTPKPTVYLRVVSRVYLTGKMDVSIFDTSAGRFDVGDPNSRDSRNLLLNLKADKTSGTEADYKQLIETTNKKVQSYGLQIATLQGRWVTMNETFDRPLVIGYLGFDFPVTEGGRLGYPVATKDMLTGIGEGGPRRGYEPGEFFDIFETLRKNPDKRAQDIVQSLTASAELLVPPSFPCLEYDANEKLLQETERNRSDNFLALIEYLDCMKSSQEDIQDALNEKSFRFQKKECSGKEHGIDVDEKSEIRSQLAILQERFSREKARIEKQFAEDEASVEAYEYYLDLIMDRIGKE